jgi:tetratricopeptide (TPR) repeat protein
MPGASAIDRLFERGHFATVIAQSCDAASFDPEAQAHIGHVIAALACQGRADDAEALLARVSERAPLSEVVLARFFIGVSACRAGAFERAQQLFLENLRAARAQRTDPLNRFYAYQGLACLRYFSGRMDKAERMAQRALKAAFAADSALGRVYATDIQSHALVQMGHVKRGLVLLERAGALADAFGFDGTHAAITYARTIYEARFGLHGIQAGIEALQRLQDKHVDDSYSARLVSLDRAVLCAFAGRADEAQSLIRLVDGQVVPEGDRRMQVRVLLTAAIVVTLRLGAEAARGYVRAAEQLLDDNWDRSLRVELLCAKAWCVSAEERAALAQELDRLARETSIARAALHAHLLDATRPLPSSVAMRDLEDDRLGALLLAVLQDNRVPQLLSERCLGLLPRALGFAPGRRMYLIEPGHLLIENQGNVTLERPGDTSIRLLKALSDNAWWSKEALLSAVWGIHGYRPDRHDSVVYMAINRTRQALGPYRSWLENHQGAYRLQGAECQVLAVQWSELQEPEARANAPISSPAAAEPESPVVALTFIREHGHATTGQLAKALQVSEMTALRELQKLVAAGVLKRVGRGRATRYELNEDDTLP